MAPLVSYAGAFHQHNSVSHCLRTWAVDSECGPLIGWVDLRPIGWVGSALMGGFVPALLGSESPTPMG